MSEVAWELEEGGMKTIIRILWLPFTLGALASTAMLEYCQDKPDWTFWRSTNDWAIQMLPFRRRARE